MFLNHRTHYSPPPHTQARIPATAAHPLQHTRPRPPQAR